MRSYPPPQVGFNNNVKHRGRVFHIQTEDSGVNHPHITTHLFVDGGQIVKSEKTDYSDLLEQGDLISKVRQCMKEQHKSMFMALRQGQLDGVIDELFGGAGPKKSSDSGAQVIAPNGAKSKSAKRRSQRPSSVSSKDGRKSVRPGVRKSSGPKQGALRPTLSTDSLAAVPNSARTESRSLFGSEPVSEQSLDDVILSYISEDLDGVAGGEE